MEASLNKYRQAIESGGIDPVVRWDGQCSRTIFDPSDADTPLDVLGFGAYRLEDGPFTVDTGDREYVLSLIVGRCEVAVAGKTFAAGREGGPFARQPGGSDGAAIYVGRGERFVLRGEGELVWFSGPGYCDKASVLIGPGERPQLARGAGVWHRDVLTLVTPDDVSSNLTMGETYSPPGLWSGTPLHVHDRDNIEGGESDHEEVYYHVARLSDGEWGPYSVQLLFDDKGLNRSYLVHNRDAVAIPGGAHPVVAGPVSDILYVWALASARPSALGMRDVQEFAYIQGVGKIINALQSQCGKHSVSSQQLDKLADEHGLDDDYQREMLRQHLAERGFQIEP